MSDSDKAPRARSASRLVKSQRSSKSELQRQAILEEASLLFIRKGFDGTNTNDIADAVGMTRTALYYYFKNKEAILQALTKGVTERASELARQVMQQAALPAAEGLRQLIVQHATLVLDHPLQFRVAERSESSLPEAQRLVTQKARRRLRDDFVSLVENGIRQDVFRPVDAQVAAFSIIGMCNWAAWWFDRRRGDPIEPIADMIADFGLRMLLKEGTERPPSPTGASLQSARAELARLRDALDNLESALR
ncbi:hypothetical protein CDEF62S_04843 [Castellaniella defragrans]